MSYGTLLKSNLPFLSVKVVVSKRSGTAAIPARTILISRFAQSDFLIHLTWPSVVTLAWLMTKFMMLSLVKKANEPLSLPYSQLSPFFSSSGVTSTVTRQRPGLAVKQYSPFSLVSVYLSGTILSRMPGVSQSSRLRGLGSCRQRTVRFVLDISY